MIRAGAAAAHRLFRIETPAAALARMELTLIHAGTHGLCEDGGEPIDERRLMAWPASPFCTACQTTHERLGIPRR